MAEIPLVDDVKHEPFESFSVVFDSELLPVARARASVTVTDDDPAPTLRVDDVTVVEGDVLGESRFTLELSNPSEEAVTVRFTTRDGSAEGGTDFEPTSGEVSIESGERTRAIVVPVFGDGAEEPHETFYLDLLEVVGAKASSHRALGTILDDDGGGTCVGPELLRNPGAEEPLARGNRLVGWQEDGDAWGIIEKPGLPDGSRAFAPPTVSRAVLYQDVDLSVLAGSIDSSGQILAFSGAVRSAVKSLPDAAQVLVELRDATMENVLEVLDTGRIASVEDWHTFEAAIEVPPGTRWARVLLIAERSGLSGKNEAFFDRLSLRARNHRVLLVDDAVAQEGDSGTTSVLVGFSLSCVSSEPLRVAFVTEDVSARAGSDYTWVEGELTIPTGHLAGQVDIDVRGDAIKEVTETLLVRLTPDTPFLPAVATVRIEDDDEEGQVCEYRPPAGAFAPTLEWSWTGSSVEPEFNDVVMTPAIGDVSGDGVPDVVVYTRADHSGSWEAPAVLRVLSGVDGAPVFELADPAWRTRSFGHPAIGDIDGDGRAEIVASRYAPAGVFALEHTGEVKWFQGAVNPRDAAIAIANVDGEGLPEIVVGASVLGADGSVRWRLDPNAGAGWTQHGIVAVADLDLDGTLEIVAGNRAWNHDGTPFFESALTDGLPSVANFDDEPFPEIVVVSNGEVRLMEHDGRPIWSVRPASLGSGGPPTVADFDGDGLPEIGVAGASYYLVLNHDGTTLWKAATQDVSSNRTGSSVFDFEGDGSAEVVYRDELYLRVYRGSDGTVLFQEANPSCTATENPVVADVDGDGNAEIIAPRDQLCGRGSSVGVFDQGVFVFGDALDNWVDARGVWNQHGYHVSNIDDDLSVPLHEAPHWLDGELNSYRRQVAVGKGSFAAPDLIVQDLAIDTGSCPSSPTALVRVANQGDNLAPARLGVSLYDGDPRAGGTLLGVEWTSDLLPPGGQHDVLFALDGERQGPVVLCASVNEPQGEGNVVNECREDNNVFCLELASLCHVPAVDVAMDDVVVGEGQAVARFLVNLSQASTKDVSVAYASVDSTATAGSDYEAASGTLVIPAGATSAPIDVPLIDDLLDEPDETFTLTLSIPVNATIVDGEAIGTILDDDPRPLASIGDVTVTEGDDGTTDAVFSVSLSAPSAFEIGMSYATADGTAFAGVDYTATSGSLVFPLGVSSQTVVVPVLGDLLDEPDETFTLTLADPLNVRLGPAATGTILDDDPPPEVTIDDVAIDEPDEGSSTAAFTLTLSAPSGREASVSYTTVEETAIAGLDYSAASGSVVFAPGETSRTVAISVLGDLMDEPDETFLVRLGDAMDLVITDSEGVGTVVDDDPRPTVSIADASVQEGDAGATPIELPVALSAPSGWEITVVWTTSAGTAESGVDYAAGSAVLTIPPGTAEAALRIDVLGDVIDELDETFTVTLSEPAHVIIEDGEAEALIVDDDEALMSIGDVTVEEGDAGTADAVFPVTLAVPSDREITVDYETIAGTATEGEDYEPVSGQLVFEPLTTENEIPVPVVGDLILEPAEETFTVKLSNVTNTTFADSTGQGTILDDEICLGPNLLGNPGAEERPVDGELPGWLAVEGAEWSWERDGAVEAPEGVAYFTAGGPEYAELAQDMDVSAYADRIATGGQAFAFEGLVRTLDEDPSDTARIVVEYRDETNTVVLDAFDTGGLASPLEWLRVEDVRPAPVGTAVVRVRLLASRWSDLSNDGYFDGLSLRSLRAATVSVGDVTTYEGDSGTHDAVFSVALACPFYQDVLLDYATADGTAVAGEDYVASAGSLALPVGQTSAEVPVPVVGDEVRELHETFHLEIAETSATEAVLLDPEGLGLILDDDFCPRTQGFWKNHAELWPTDYLVIGGVEYDVDGVLALLLYEDGDDMSHLLAKQLAATKLNLLTGSDPWIVPTIEDADAFLVAYPPGSDPRGEERTYAESLKDALDRYNKKDRDTCKENEVMPGKGG